jgi:predicted protein tyrosine phosphatase
MRKKLLFVCSANRKRSPTAEALFKGSRYYEARSGGTSERARIKLSEGLIGWSDSIFVMEKRHRELMFQRFASILNAKSVTVLDIPDDFAFMDEDLIELLRARLSPYLEGIE